jgi:hypothetical protein
MINKLFQQKGKHCFILLLLTVGLSNLMAQSYTKEERMYCLSMLWKDVSSKFHNPEHLRQVNWDSLYVANIERAIHSKNDREYYKLLEEFIAVLNDGHTEIRFDRDSSIDYLPIEIRILGEDYYILGIVKEKITEIPLGSKMLKINNLPTAEYLQRYIFPYISAQTKQDKTRKALAYFRNNGKTNDSISFTIQTPEGQVVQTEMKYDGKNKRYTMNDFVMTRFAKTQYIRETDWYLADDSFGNKYYRLRLDGFSTNNVMKTIEKMSTDNISQADYIILDLQYNTGGSESEADSLLACFLNTDTLITYPSLTRIDDAFYAAMGLNGYIPEYEDYYNNLAIRKMPPGIKIKKDLPLFSQPLFVLISATTYSAAEDFLIPLKLHYPDRAILVGMPTGGSTGAPFVRDLPHHNAYYRICVRRPQLPEGLFENGIQPDYFYEPTIEDVLANKIKQIDEYVAKLFSKLKK